MGHPIARLPLRRRLGAFADALHAAKTIKQLADFYGVKLNKAEADTVVCSKEHMTRIDYRPLNPPPGQFADEGPSSQRAAPIDVGRGLRRHFDVKMRTGGAWPRSKIPSPLASICVARLG